MTAKEYLNRARRLDQEINSNIEDAKNLRESATNIVSPGFDEQFNPNRPTEPPFVQKLETVWELEQEINDMIDRLVDMKKQIRKVIEAVPDAKERTVLTYRYLCNMTWKEIGVRMHADRTTVYRWHEKALGHISLPDDVAN